MKKRKPRPGSLPLKTKAPAVAPVDSGFDPTTAHPPWWTQKDEDEAQRRQERAERDSRLTALGKARRKVEELAGDVRTDAFTDWVRRCVVPVDDPRDWTQARILYENYLAHAKTYGNNRAQKALAVEELSTETQWGRMMATMFPKKRRTRGLYYPLRCKRG